MKTKFLSIVFLFALSFIQAQDNALLNETENIVASYTTQEKLININVVVTKNNSLFIDTSKVKEIIARSSSDIRIYLNKKRKLSNFKIVFQEKYKAIRV